MIHAQSPSRFWSRSRTKNAASRRAARGRRFAWTWEACEARVLMASEFNPPTLAFGVASYTFGQFNDFLSINVVRTLDLSGTVSVAFTTEPPPPNNSGFPAGQAGVNYVTTSGRLTFGPGVTEETFDVPILNTPFSSSPKFTIGLALSNPSEGAVLGTPSVATLTFVAGLVVTNTADSTTDNIFGSLREVIGAANELTNPGTIFFNIPGAGPHTIAPQGALPAITKSVTLNARSQPGFNGSPIIEISGARIPPPVNGQAATDGLDVLAGNTTINGLVIDRFSGSAIGIAGPGNNTIVGNYLGTNLAGTQALSNLCDGLNIFNSSHNTIGGVSAVDANVFSGNACNGIEIGGAGSIGNVILGNKIGTDVTGTHALPNGLDGVFLNGVSNTLIGAAAAGAGNLISGNGVVGVQVLGASGNVLTGNKIGTDVSGRAALPNQTDGVFLNGASGNTVCGNLIAGNGSVGVQVFGPGATANTIQGNQIGAAAGQSRALGNSRDGVFINGASGNLVAANVIAGNGSVGVQVFGPVASGNVLQNNIIGNGAGGPGNGRDGVFLNGAPRNVVMVNTITGNVSVGLQVFGASATGDVILGNTIRGNAYGLFINQAPGYGNTLTTQNVVTGNRIANLFRNPAPGQLQTAGTQKQALSARAYPRFRKSSVPALR
jgi:hypothetical protein